MDDFELDDLDYWRLCDELDIRQAALLIAGQSPAEWSSVELIDIEKRPLGYEAAKSAVRNALRGGRIEGNIVPDESCDINGNPYFLPDTFSLDSRVNVDSLREWLAGRGFQRGFFFPDKGVTPDYLNPKHPRYAPKLAAAVQAWFAVPDAAGKHPKQALTKWLRENAAGYGLTDDDGKPNETGIEEIAKVTNWQPGGGAPRSATS